VSGYGQTGPGKGRPAVDNVIQAISGVMSVTGEPGRPPVQIGAPLADVAASMCAAVAILGALYGVQRDGIGRYIDVSMQASFIYALAPRLGGVLQGCEPPTAIGNQNPMRVPADVYRTRDGVDLFIVVPNDRNWEPFCRALDRPDWVADLRFASNRARTVHRAEINQLVHAAIAEFESEELCARLAAERATFGRVNNYAEAVSDPQLLARGVVRDVEHLTSGPIKVIGPPWIINGEQTPVSAPPALGQHTRAVLRDWLGLEDE
jgi:crotonobetainyl-CoA:carnitine CoA-transferase CaiB-like acyl-CoA transferase